MSGRDPNVMQWLPAYGHEELVTRPELADAGPEQHRQLTAEPGLYVTEVSVPDPGDGGVQRLHSHLKEPEVEPEPEA